MSELNRREFVVVGAAAVACACACSVAEAADAPGGPNAPAQSKGPVDVGPKSNYAKDGVTDTWTKTQRILVIRNDGKIYAANSTCTHKNCAVRSKDGEIVCPCHGSRFSLEGTPTKGPAKISLYRYGISEDDKGHLIVDKSKQFEEKKWDDEGAFVKV